MNSSNNTTEYSSTAKFLMKSGVWLGLFGVLWILRAFSLLIFLTFVFAWVQGNAVDRLEGYIKWRTGRVILVGATFLALVLGVITFLAPHVRDQATALVSSLPQALRQFDAKLYELRNRSNLWAELIPQPSLNPDGSPAGWDLKRSPAAQALEGLLGIAADEEGKATTKELVEKLRVVAERGLNLGSSFLLSILFSFLIVLDLPDLTGGIRRLKESRVAIIYNIVGRSISDFAKVLGSALEAQLYIAILNTILTAIGIQVLGISGSVAFLSVVVFFCSFIPVAGVFLSSVPICLLAFQKGGVGLMLGAALLIWIIHLIEAYILNPKIYGHALRVNPVLVLIILTIGGKLFGVWGLVLGLPVCTYVFGRAIWTEV
jgi:predicted PurR-regulated permease PerM